MRTVVLMGAGASFGSFDAKPHTPPLGDRLFEELERAGGVAAQLPPELKKIFHDGNFETGMAAYYDYSGRNIMRFQRELAYYLARFQPGRKNVYIRLIEELGVHRIIYSSINYDLLFEESASMLGLNTCYGFERPNGFVRLLKVHGSSNFWPDMPVGTLRNVNIGAIKIDIESPVRALNREDTIYRCIHEDSVAPAMAIYAEGKVVKVCPSYVGKQQEIWVSSVKRARKVFVVGVRVHPVDQHIWGTLGQCKADLTYFGFPSDRDDFLKWKDETHKRNALFVEADFSQCISIIKRRLN